MPFGMLRKAERAMDQKQKGLVERDSESLNPSRTQSPQEESGSEDEKDRKSKHVKRHNKHAYVVFDLRYLKFNNDIQAHGGDF